MDAVSRSHRVRWPAWLVALSITFLASNGWAAVPHETAVPAYAEEQTIVQLEQGLAEPGLTSSRSGIHHFDRNYIVPPGTMTEQSVILQRGGNTWRVLRNGPIATTAAALTLGTLLLIAVYYFTVGPMSTPPDTGRQIVRFTRWQRFVHWSTAIVFVLLALTGLVLLFGKKILLPWMGHDAFSTLAMGSKYVHNFSGPLFVLLTIVMFFTFVRQNGYRTGDWNWLKRLGGMISHRPAPAGYFNAGEKLWFWLAVTGLGMVMALTGLMLNFPYYGEVGSVSGLGRYLLQLANYLHLGGATLYVAGSLGHIYLGTIGSPGAWGAMVHGTVDESWAREHHDLWYEDVKRGVPGTPPLGNRSVSPAAHRATRGETPEATR